MIIITNNQKKFLAKKTNSIFKNAEIDAKQNKLLNLPPLSRNNRTKGI